MYAVIETGGKQYRVEVGTELAVELLDAAPGESITIDRVLLVADGAEAAIGRPLVDGASVAAEVLRRDRADKVISFKYRPKARRRVKKGHRQEQTILRVTDVVVGGKSAAEAARKAEADAQTERERLEEAAARQAAEDAALATKLAAKAAKAAKAAEAAETAEPAGDGPRTEAGPKSRASRAKAAEAAEPAPKKSRAKAAPAEPGSAPAPKRARTKKDE
jgi:large subunit ribosomal protein L21